MIASRDTIDFRIYGVAAALPWVVAASLAAQVTARSLAPANASLADGFTRIVATRELNDGRLLLIDDAERRLLVADFTSGEVREVSRAGQGPGEYRQLNGLHALGGDTSLVEDQLSRKWIILVRDRPVRTVSTAGAGLRWPPQLFGADHFGRLLDVPAFSFHDSPGIGRTQIRPNAESLLVVVRRRDAAVQLSGRADTVRRIRGGGRGQTRAMRKVVENGPRIPWLLNNPLAVEDQALLFRDGWIALAYPEPYRIDWIAPNGATVKGSPIAERPVPVDANVKRALTRAKYPKADPPFDSDELPPWPATLPGFLNRALLASPDGRLVVQRVPNPREPGNFYDFIDRNGKLSSRLLVKRTDRIVGFGERSVYLATKDEDDVEWLSRHSWP